MNCSCRTAALRIFVRSIVESQQPVYASRASQPSPVLLRNRAANPLQTAFTSYSSPRHFQRSLTTTATARKETDRGATPNKSGRLDSPSILNPPRKAKSKANSNKKDAPIDAADEAEPRSKEDWQIQKAALRAKFPEGWNPRKRLSPDALAGIRALHEQFPDEYTTDVLAQKFEVSPEAIRRILRSKWAPSPEEEIERQERWFNRGKKVWARWAELGKKPPQRWRREGIIRDPSWNEKKGSGRGSRGRSNAQRKLSQTLL